MIHPHNTRPASFRVLIVDDEPIQRLILTRCVEMSGWVADTAASVEEAIASFRAFQHDMVVIDLCLGEQDGIHLLEHLRHRGADPSVIFVSGMDDRTRAAAFRIAGNLGLRVAGTLAKPVDRYALHALMLSDPTRPHADVTSQLFRPTPRNIEHALLVGEIYTEYQPKIDLMTGAMIGVEALARWLSPSHGLIPPDQFIPVAEQSGLINRLTYHVLHDAVAACGLWRKLLPNCSVAVNISPLVLSDPRLLPEIESLLSQNRVPQGALILEVTESSLIGNIPAAAEILTRLSIKGIRISMDDFGTGYASLQSLMRMPFTELKIDRSFVGVCQTDPEAWKIVRATLALARELGIRVVAEGVETVEISTRLAEAGCDMGQGWLYGRSMGAEAISRLINSAVALTPALTPHADARIMEGALSNSLVRGRFDMNGDRHLKIGHPIDDLASAGSVANFLKG
jgi:EAL domain-containing protein (putative c-di-GMP-specific phosphodiesterase class I)/ActR/RegA family two-component response regulator